MECICPYAIKIVARTVNARIPVRDAIPIEGHDLHRSDFWYACRVHVESSLRNLLQHCLQELPVYPGGQSSEAVTFDRLVVFCCTIAEVRDDDTNGNQATMQAHGTARDRFMPKLLVEVHHC